MLIKFKVHPRLRSVQSVLFFVYKLPVLKFGVVLSSPSLSQAQQSGMNVQWAWRPLGQFFSISDFMWGRCASLCFPVPHSPSLWTWWTSSSRTLKARPKSINLKTPSWLDQRMLPGLRSPWTMFPLWREKRETRISWANLRLAHGDSPRLSFL